MDVGFHIDVADVGLRRVEGDSEALGDVLDGAAAHEQVEHVALAGREPVALRRRIAAQLVAAGATRLVDAVPLLLPCSALASVRDSAVKAAARIAPRALRVVAPRLRPLRSMGGSLRAGSFRKRARLFPNARPLARRRLERSRLRRGLHRRAGHPR